MKAAPSFRVFPKEQLHSFTTNVFVKMGVPKEEAILASDVLSMSDLRGIDSHGVARMSTYYELLKAGRINPKPKIKIIRETPSTASVDGDNGLGLVVGPKANQIAIEKASKVGSGWVSVSNTNHYGIAAYYTLQCLKKDMIGFSMTNSTKLVVPLWGSEAMLGTNPISIAFPGKEDPPIVVDMATSAAAYGKVEIAHRKGQKLPEGWCVNAEGYPTTDPEDVIKRGGNLLPLGTDRERGGHKGYGLSVAVDILCALLSGANWGPFCPPFTLAKQFNQDPRCGQMGKGIGHFFGAMSIDGFVDVDEFKQKIDEYRKVFKGTKPAPDTNGPLIPGDPETEQEIKRGAEGIPIVMPVVEDLQKIAKDCGVDL
eukprot:TRINITY_DN14942_c0_g1_i1.p1 TRINITY_DN14942_c0_g1~~TRINITY_DN14942_c0_g1_i1.p1  ORF type:complete len:369 (+),score=89.34 TRINITY_DN14942_c0_g1_i1:607-1713(+)